MKAEPVFKTATEGLRWSVGIQHVNGRCFATLQGDGGAGAEVRVGHGQTVELAIGRALGVQALMFENAQDEMEAALGLSRGRSLVIRLRRRAIELLDVRPSEGRSAVATAQAPSLRWSNSNATAAPTRVRRGGSAWHPSKARHVQ